MCYGVRVAGRRKPEPIFHVNMLRKWHSPTAVSFFAEEKNNNDISDHADNVVTWKDTDEGTLQLSEHFKKTFGKSFQSIAQ